MMKDLFDQETEKAVLGCMLMDSDAFKYGVNTLEESDFFVELNGKVFSVMKKMYKNSELVDVVSLSQRLSETINFNDVGFLTQLAMTPGSSVHIKDYVKLLKEKSYRRNVLKKIESIKKCVSEKDISEVSAEIDKLESLSIQSSELLPISNVLESSIRKICENMKAGVKYSGLRSKFWDLDVMTGGFQNSDLIIIAARPSMGKTAFMLDIVRQAADSLINENKIAVIFSLEMSAEQLSMRMFSSETGIKADKLKFCKLSVDDLKNINTTMSGCQKRMDSIFVSDNGSINVSDMFSQCQSIKSATCKSIGLIAVDYLQLINTKGENRTVEISAISRSLKQLAKHFNCPVICLSQLSRACEQRTNRRPMLSDLRESGAIEQDADIVLFLYRDKYYNKDSEMGDAAEVIIAKQRNGPVGVIRLLFDEKRTTFKNMEKR